jgi:PhnB protein
MTARDNIAALCQRLIQAHHDKDVDAIVACYADDARIFDLAPPLSSTGLSRQDTVAWLATWRGPIEIDAADVDLVVDGDSAWSTALTRMRGVKIDGATVDLWFRTTRCFCRRDAKWLIAHDQSSTPFYMDGSLRAAVDLTPDAAVAWNASVATDRAGEEEPHA